MSVRRPRRRRAPARRPGLGSSAQRSGIMCAAATPHGSAPHHLKQELAALQEQLDSSRKGSRLSASIAARAFEDVSRWRGYVEDEELAAANATAKRNAEVQAVMLVKSEVTVQRAEKDEYIERHNASEDMLGNLRAEAITSKDEAHFEQERHRDVESEVAALRAKVDGILKTAADSSQSRAEVLRDLEEHVCDIDERTGELEVELVLRHEELATLRSSFSRLQSEVEAQSRSVREAEMGRTSVQATEDEVGGMLAAAEMVLEAARADARAAEQAAARKSEDARMALASTKDSDSLAEGLHEETQRLEVEAKELRDQRESLVGDLHARRSEREQQEAFLNALADEESLATQTNMLRQELTEFHEVARLQKESEDCAVQLYAVQAESDGLAEELAEMLHKADEGELLWEEVEEMGEAICREGGAREEWRRRAEVAEQELSRRVWGSARRRSSNSTVGVGTSGRPSTSAAVAPPVQRAASTQGDRGSIPRRPRLPQLSTAGSSSSTGSAVRTTPMGSAGRMTPRPPTSPSAGPPRPSSRAVVRTLTSDQ